MERIAIGDILKNFIGVEGIICDIDDLGIELYISFSNITEEEIKEYSEGKLKLGLLYTKGIIFIFSKYGNCPWNEAPFSVNLAINWESKEISPDFEVKKDLGIGVSTISIEGTTGEVKSLRVTAAPNRFTCDLRKMIEKQKQEDFNKEEFDKNLADILKKYSTKDLVKFANIY